MTEPDRRKAILAALEQEIETSMDRKQARAYLIQQGVLTKKGKLRARLRAAAQEVAA